MKPKYHCIILALLMAGSWSAECAFSQTTLSGDQIITGNLSVGTSATTGNIVVSGNTGSSAAPAMIVSGDGGVLFTGTQGVGTIAASGTGARFLWYPKQAAIRAGDAYYPTSWDASNIGTYSAAFGRGAFAPATASFASGEAGATGVCSAALGQAQAMGGDSAAFGGGIAAYAYSGAWGSGFAYADHASAIGYGNAFGVCSFASGTAAYANGNLSTAFGDNIVAQAYDQFVVGRFNVTRGTSTSWVEGDPLFVVGNGTGNPSDASAIQNRDALVVFKSGTISMAKRQGDIMMGEFGNTGD